jgi:tRNA-dihydrouridine synthase
MQSMRVGGAGTDGLEAAIGASTDLLAPLEGIRNAAVRQHAAEGGSYGALAKAMDIKQATAQHRRDTLLKNDPSPMEQWATGSN